MCRPTRRRSPPARDGRTHAAAWLAKTKPGDEHASRGAAACSATSGRASPRRNSSRGSTRLLGLQNEDGGWGQDKDLPSDAYATGQALYFLSLAGVARDRTEIQRAVTFLVANQKEDGSWPMTSRAHPGAKPMTNPVPITYFGSAWATLGLMRSVPK